MSSSTLPKSQTPRKRPPTGPKSSIETKQKFDRSGYVSPVPSSSKEDRQQKFEEKRNTVVNLITNAYSIHIKHSNTTIYEYIPQINLSEGYRDLPPQVLFRNFVSRGIRKTIIQQLIPQLINSDYPKGSVVIEQNLEAIYSAIPFRNRTTTETFSDSDSTFKFKNIYIQADLLSRIRVDITFKFNKTFTMNSDHNINFTLVNSILHHQLWLSMLKYGAVYFLSPEYDQETHHSRREPRKLDLMSDHVMGFSLSGLRQTVNNQAIVVIHCPHSYITRSHRLIDLLASFIRGYPIQNIRLLHDASDREIRRSSIVEIQDIQGNENWFHDLSSLLNGFKCRAFDPLEEREVNLRFNLTEDSSSNLVMNDPSAPNHTLTVQQYYRSIGINLNYPNLPCLKSRSTKHPFYPFELCSLLPDQKVPIFRLSLMARNHLNMLNKPKPDLAYRSSYNAKNNIESITRNELKSFGLSLSKVSVEAQGLVLKKPTLQFRDQLIKPERDHWESGQFFQAVELSDNWCVVNTVEVDLRIEDMFFENFSKYTFRHGLILGRPYYLFKPKQDLIDNENAIVDTIEECQRLTRRQLRLILFVIDSTSSHINRLVHISFDEHRNVSATCLRLDSILNSRQHRSIFRTLGHKLNARLGGTNVVYHQQTLASLDINPGELMIIGLDVTHPDNELKGFSIVGCAYTFSSDLFKHRSLVWPQTARVEIIGKIDILFKRILQDYYHENNKNFPKNIIVYRDGVSHEEFDRVNEVEVKKVLDVLLECSKEKHQSKPSLSYIIAQKRHSMRFFQQLSNDSCTNPPSGTLIDRDIVVTLGREFYLYSNISPQATSRPLHYHVLLEGLSFDKLQKLTYFLCFNFGKCSGSLSMPSSLKYAHNAAYDARNRVIASREFSETKFYTSKFFC